MIDKYVTLEYRARIKASNELHFATPTGNVDLVNGVKTAISQKSFDFLKEKSEEFKSCLETKIIVETGDEPEIPPTPKTDIKSSSDNSGETEESVIESPVSTRKRRTVV